MCFHGKSGFIGYFWSLNRFNLFNFVLFLNHLYVQVDMTGVSSFSKRDVYPIQPRIPELYNKRGFSYVKRPYYQNIVDQNDEIDDFYFDFSSTDSFDSDGNYITGLNQAIRKTCRQEYHGEQDGVLRKEAVVRSDEEVLKLGKRFGRDYWMKKTEYEKRLEEEKKSYFLKMSTD